jgi:NADH-quinone oxidoreductase E subunit
VIVCETTKSKMEAIRSQFPTEQALLLPLLHEIQRKEGWISEGAMSEAAAFLHLPLAKVKEVVTFYTMYNRKPVGKYHIQVCTNIACFLRGSDQILECFEKKLGISCGETTADRKFTLSEVECLAACGTAPVMQVNDDYHENLDLKACQAIIDQLS